MKKWLVGTALLMSLSACSGYQQGNCTWSGRSQTVSIPYVHGDKLGYLTSALARELSSSGMYCYRDCEGEYRLEVSLSELEDSNIGYRYDRKGEDGRIRQRVIPAEGRAKVVATVALYPSGCCEPVLGPVLIEGAVDFDFDVYANHSQDNLFSLGQLNDRDVSRDLVTLPLYRQLAQNIVDYLTNTW